MSIWAAFFVFGAIMLIYVFIAEVFTVLFRLTGMPEKKAHFQVISLLTNSGYTTAESELIIASPRRRDLAQKTMLFGYAFAVSIVSALVNLLFSLKLAEMEDLLFATPIPIFIIAFFVCFKRVPKLRAWFNRTIESVAGQVLARSKGNRILLMDSLGHSVMAQLHLESVPKNLKNLPLSETNLREYGVTVMLIKRRGEEALQANGDTMLREDDHLVLFGDLASMEEIFDVQTGGAPEETETPTVA